MESSRAIHLQAKILVANTAMDTDKVLIHMVRVHSMSKVAEIMIGEDKLTHFLGVGQGLLRGASHHVLDEAERSQHDALCVMSQIVIYSMVLLGGGWPEITWKL